MNDIYNQRIKRKRLGKEDLKYGDLVFFVRHCTREGRKGYMKIDDEESFLWAINFDKEYDSIVYSDGISEDDTVELYTTTPLERALLKAGNGTINGGVIDLKDMFDKEDYNKLVREGKWYNRVANWLFGRK